MSDFEARAAGDPAVVVAADRTRARIFHCEGPNCASLVESETLLHAESRLRDHELVADAPGRNVGAGHPQGSTTVAGSPHEQEAGQFAQQIAARLARLRTDNALGRLYLVAEPHMLGLLRAALDEQTQRLIVGEVHSRLTEHSAQDLRAALPRRL